jgi:hypothetical protein
MAFGIDDIIGGVLGVVNKFIPDKNAQAAAEAELRSQLLALSASQDHDQSATNTAEAANASLFVAGWRPMIGWTCALALFYQYLGRPIFITAAGVFHWQIPAIPALDDNLWQLMFGMLGMGGLRSFEKLKGVAGGNPQH